MDKNDPARQFIASEVQRPAPADGGRAQEFAMPAEADLDLVREFCSEAVEHLRQSEVALLALESDPGDREPLNTVFRSFHNIKGVAGFLGLSCVTEIAHQAETFFDRVRKGRLVLSGASGDLAFEAVDMLKLLLCGLRDGAAAGRMLLPPAYDSLLSRLENAVRREEDGAVQGGHGGVESGGGVPEHDGTVRVSAAQLERLMRLVDELIAAESSAGQAPNPSDRAGAELARHLSRLAEITRAVQEAALSLKRVTLKPTFDRMARLVRDLARQSGKEIRFETEGGEIGVDRRVAEAIADPLMHMVRNAAGHGIESPEEREREGKPRAGRILLCAAREDGALVISLWDDGCGLDRKKILAKAVECGLAEAGGLFGDEEIRRLIFSPGFSTADNVTGLSGRGVGLDVVRSNVDALGGSVDVFSEEGEGCVFSLRLPQALPCPP